MAGSLALAALTLTWGVAFAAQGSQKGETGDRVVFGDSLVVTGGQTVQGNVLVVGGDLGLEEGGRVTGDVTALGGSLELSGQVDGSVVSIGSVVEVTEAAQIAGETVAVGGEVQVADDASLAGGYVRTPGPTFGELSALPGWSTPPASPTLPRRMATFTVAQVAGGLVKALRDALVVGALATLVLLMWPEPLSRIGQAVRRAPAASGGVGCLSMVLFPLVSAVLVVTLVLAPLAAVVLLALLVLSLLGWVAVGTLFGKRLLAWFGLRESTLMSAGLAGTFSLTLLFGMVRAIPGLGFLGVLLGVVLAAVGVGAVILTWFGRRSYAPVAVAPKEGEGSSQHLVEAEADSSQEE